MPNSKHIEQREIKFNAFNTHDNEWYGDAMAKMLMYRETIGEEYDHDKWKIVEFTGLKDKNGKRIHEGDIIKKQKERDNYPLNYTVVFNETELGFRLRWVGHKKQSGFYDEKISGIGCKTFEIIGNIYEHPNLLQP